MVYHVSRDTLTHPQKTWICQKFCMCYFASLRQDGMIELVFRFFWDEECVLGRINANLLSKIRDAKSCN